MHYAGPLLAEAAALIEAGRKGEAVLLVNRLAAMEDAAALSLLADWRLSGGIVPQDLALARDLYRRAGDAGNEAAAWFHTNLLANGLGGPRDWAGALRRLKAEARRDPRRRRTLAAVDGMKLTPAGDPAALPEPKRLSESPDVLLVPRLLSAAECDYLVEAAKPGFRPSVIVDVRTGREYQDPIRTSEGSTMHWLIEDPAVHALNRRLAAIGGTAAEQGEPLQILRYRPGQQYRNHMDWLPGEANRRMTTALVWLNEGYGGGETVFVRTGLQVKGRKGDALLFRNGLPDGRPDPASEHAGLPVTKGIKLLASRWIRERRHMP
jgi:prolyl 4-hydroxylase